MRVVWLLAAIAVGELLSAQSRRRYDDEVHRASELLTSPNWTDKAWGAYLAGRLRSNDLNQQLVEQVRTTSAVRGALPHTEEYAFTAVLMDALIEGRVEVPAVLLEPFVDPWTDQIVILLARQANNHEVLMRLRSDSSRDIVWLAANNMLAEKRLQRWYEEILSELSVTHRFIVTNLNQGLAVGRGQGGGRCGDGVFAMPKDFPPVTLYSLTDTDTVEPGSVLLAKGPRDVYYRRTIVPTNQQVGSGTCGTVLDRLKIRIGYLAELRSASIEETERLFRGETYINYSTDENFERICRLSMMAQEQSIREFLKGLSAVGLSVPNTSLQIVAEVEDLRDDVKRQLPVVAPRVVRLR